MTLCSTATLSTATGHDSTFRATAKSVYKSLTGVSYTTAKPNLSLTLASTNSNAASPLIIINGKEASNSQMKDLKPDTIESIVVKTGTDAAIYGKKGANGVIDIKTKGSGNNNKY